MTQYMKAKIPTGIHFTPNMKVKTMGQWPKIFSRDPKQEKTAEPPSPKCFSFRTKATSTYAFLAFLRASSALDAAAVAADLAPFANSKASLTFSPRLSTFPKPEL